MNHPHTPERLSFTVVGMSDEATPRLAPEVLEAIATTRIFSGGKRHRSLVSALLPEGAEWIDVVVPLSQVFERYRAYDEPIFVFASGDPLFFGYTTTLMREFPGRVQHTYPYFNSLQLLCHALTLPYHDMRVCSLTGRPWDEFDRALIERTTKLGILTDGKHTPSAIAERMLHYGYKSYKMHIGERLGGGRQQVRSMTLEEAVQETFAQPNCVVIEATEPLDYCAPLGLPETDFELLNGRTKMITKMPIRLLSLSMMELHKRRVMWDVGFCTGSVSVEARLQFPHLHVESFEIRPEGEALITANAQRHGTPGICHHIGDFVEVDTEGLPRPDAAFIGGHGGNLIAIVDKLTKALTPGGVIVFNSVSESTLDLFEEAIAHVGWHISGRMRLALDEHNPITILQAKQ